MSNSSKYFEVKVEIVVGQTNSGKDKLQKEIYLVDAMTVTEAEAHVVKDFEDAGVNLDFTISSAKESKIERVIQ